MKLNTLESPVETGFAIAKPKQFSIAASREAFITLSSGLYNNKVRAIIRELSCNAYDAHIAAGKKEVPFEIHFPTAFEPTFSVKDFGTGLSDHDLQTLYTTYFASNKTDSNEQIGALGLGSKSPFCYTEGFTVTSRFEGKTRIYSAYIGQLGPEILLLNEEDTPDEQNGLEVSFPVKSKDFSEFKNNAEYALEFFNPFPICNIALDPETIKYKIKNDSWGLREDPWVDGKDGVRAIQGLVPYAVGSIDSSKMTDQQKLIAEMPIDLFFPIGELSVAASRESLSNDERTIANILKMYDKVKADFIVDVKKKIAEAKTGWEAMLAIQELKKTAEIKEIINAAYLHGELNDNYGSFSIGTTRPTINQLDYSTIKISEFNSTWRSNGDAKKSHFFGYTKEEREKAEKDLNLGWTKKKNYDVAFDVGPNVGFIINDLTHGGEKFIHYFVQSANQTLPRKSQVYCFAKANKDITIEQVQKTSAAILTQLGNPPVVLLSALKEQYKDIFDKTKPENIVQDRTILQFVRDSYRISKNGDGYGFRAGWRNAWKVPKMPLPVGQKFYIPIKSLKPTNYEFAYAEDLYDFIKAVRSSELFGPIGEIYAVHESNTKLMAHPDWVDFLKFVLTQLPEVVASIGLEKLSLQSNPFNLHAGRKQLLAALAESKTLNPNGELSRFSKRISAALGDVKKDDFFSTVLQKAERLGFYKPEKLIDFNALHYEMVRKYPLLDQLKDYYLGYALVEDIIEYANLLDAERERQEVNKTVELAFATVQEINLQKESNDNANSQAQVN